MVETRGSGTEQISQRVSHRTKRRGGAGAMDGSSKEGGGLGSKEEQVQEGSGKGWLGGRGGARASVAGG